MGSLSTRGSLLGRLRQEGESAAAWEEFVRIYSPQVLRWCRGYGLQENDAADLCQDVLVRFWKQAATFDYDPARRFRGYLRQILASALSGWSAKRSEKPLGTPEQEALLDSLPAREDLLARIEEAYDTELLALAMRDVQPRVSPHTWRAFEMLALEHRRGRLADGLGPGQAGGAAAGPDQPRQRGGDLRGRRGRRLAVSRDGVDRRPEPPTAARGQLAHAPSGGGDRARPRPSP